MKRMGDKFDPWVITAIYRALVILPHSPHAKDRNIGSVNQKIISKEKFGLITFGVKFLFFQQF